MERLIGGKRFAILTPQADKIEAVGKVDALRKLGVAARVAGDHAGRSRMFNALLGGAKTTARSLGRALHQLWLEVTGTLFLAIAAFGALAMIREYEKFHAGQATASRLAIALAFTLAFAWFGVSSFWKVRRKSQHQ